MIGRLGFLALALGLGAFAHLSGEKAGAAVNAAADPDQLAYLPEGRVLRLASLGHRNLFADFVWLRAIQYYGEQRINGSNYDQAERLFHVIYDLDPRFKGATRFGALVLAQDARTPHAAIELLERAAAEDPDAWEYPFDVAFVYQSVLKDYKSAGEAYRRASRLPGAPSLAARLAGLSLARLGDRQAAREVWLAFLAEAENDMMRQVAERNLNNLVMEEAQEVLTRAVDAFRASAGRDPRSWAELIEAGLLTDLPVEPFGGTYLLDPSTGEVWSTTHVDRRMAQEREIYANLLAGWRARHGSNPAELRVLVERGVVMSLPWQPFGLTLEYEPRTGELAWNPPWPELEPGKHGGRGT